MTLLQTESSSGRAQPGLPGSSRQSLRLSSASTALFRGLNSPLKLILTKINRTIPADNRMALDHTSSATESHREHSIISLTALFVTFSGSGDCLFKSSFSGYGWIPFSPSERRNYVVEPLRRLALNPNLFHDSPLHGRQQLPSLPAIAITPRTVLRTMFVDAIRL
jgi:hypothetical protein